MKSLIISIIILFGIAATAVYYPIQTDATLTGEGTVESPLSVAASISTGTAVLAGKAGGQTLIGGTGTTDDLTLQSTSGVGTTGALIQFKVGNNGGTTAATILNTGVMGFGSITSPVSGSLELPGNTSNSSLKVGAFELQSYSVNNAWLSDNVYYNGSNFVFRANGYGAMNYFYNGVWHVRVATSSGTAGGTFTPKIPLVVNTDQSVAIGGDVSAGTGVSGAYVAVQSTGMTMNVPTILKTQTPASSGAAGVAGQVAWDASYFYVCTATNTWTRIALAW